MGVWTTLASAGAGQLLADGSPRGLRAAPDGGAPPPATPATRVASDDPLIDPMSEAGQQARGLYFSAPVYKRLGAKGIIRRLRAANMNAAVIDMKDGEGRVNYDTQIPSLQPQKRRFIDDMPAFVAELKAGGVYTIARVVCFSDPYLPKNEPERAVMDNRERKAGQVWANWGGRNTWLDPYNPKNHQLIVDMVKEVEALGVDEIQLDYVRWPVDEAVKFAKFPAEVATPRREVLLGMLKQIDEAIRIPLGADVFGLTALRRGDPAGLGQSLEDWTAHLEVFSPMLYINGMQSLIRRGGPARAQNLVFAATNALRQRIGPLPVIRPFLQGFSRGADYYNAEFIAEQVRGVFKANGDGFLFWHPGSNYKMVQAGMVGPATGMNPLPLGNRLAARREHWGDSASARTAVAAARVPSSAAAQRASMATASAGSTALALRGGAALNPPRRATVVRGPGPRRPARSHLQVRVPPGALPPELAVDAPAPTAEGVGSSSGAAAEVLAPALQPAPVASPSPLASPTTTPPPNAVERTIPAPTPPTPGAGLPSESSAPAQPSVPAPPAAAPVPPPEAAMPPPAAAAPNAGSTVAPAPAAPGVPAVPSAPAGPAPKAAAPPRSQTLPAAPVKPATPPGSRLGRHIDRD